MSGPPRRRACHDDAVKTAIVKRQPSRAAVLVFLAGVFLLKATVALQLDKHPLLQPDTGLDTTAYVELARRVLAGDVALGPGLYYVAPLYIYFLAAVYGATKSFAAV